MSKVIILNGPPGVGKDTIANELDRQHGAFHIRVKDELYSDAYQIFQKHGRLSFEEFLGLMNDRDKKEKPSAELSGFSPRQALILTSEEVYKRIYGNDYYGELAANIAKKYISITSEQANVVFSDGGFIEEVKAIAKKSPTLLVRLHRDGFLFDGDSRSYVRNAAGVEKEIDIHLEEGNVQFAVDEIAGAAGII